MEGTYLLNLFKSLNKEEREAFVQFTAMQLVGGNKIAAKVQALVNWLLKAAPGFNPQKLKKQDAFQAVFNDEPLADGKLEKVMVATNKFLKTFLIEQHSQKAAHFIHQQIAWVNILKERGLDFWQQKSLQQLQKAQHQKSLRDPEFYYHQFRIDFAIYQNEAAHNQLKGDLNVPRALQSLDLFYHIARLELLNHYLLQRRVTNLGLPKRESFSWNNIPIPSNYLEESPVLLISDKISELLCQDLPPLADFQELSLLLKAHENSIAPDLLQQFYTYLRNFCAFLINSGSHNLLPLFHQLQRDNLERGYLYHDGQRISASAYLSVATGAIRVGNLEWARQFVETHKGQVIGDNAAFDLYRLNAAQCLFAGGKFEEALDHIAPVFDFLNYTLLAKRLEIKILYELQSELLPYKAGAFKIFLTRASQKFMPDELRRPNADFVNVVHQMLRSKPGQRGRSERLLSRIQAKPHTAERDWLIEKAAKLF